ncbi:PepSY-associated TM helix domain-containing protein [Parapedobacter defluvii]|uniref:PepSY-associated TM helix domain-containing protein n=1 Tax=Parapedobacter defluvii TaxID=2045106 RepID=UPI00333E428F
MAKQSGKAERNGKKWFWQLHHWVGLYTGILIGVLSLTGAVAVFIPEIDGLIQRYHYNALSSAPSNGLPQFSKSIDSLTHQFPDYRSWSIRLPHNPRHAAVLDMIIRPKTGRTQRMEFFIDIGKDRVLGHRKWQNSLANYLRQIHVRLYDGIWGRQLVGIGGIALAFVALTGLLIYGNFMKKQAWPNFRKTLDTRIRMADWHKILGMSALAFNLVIALTGAWLGLQPWLARWFDISAPRKYKSEILMEAKDDKEIVVDWDVALRASHEAFPDLKPLQLLVSSNGAGTITLRGNIPGTIYERDVNMIVLSKIDYKPLFKYDLREQPISHQLYYIQEALHFGDFGGLPLKVLYAILGLTSGFLSISGFVIFLFRRKKKMRKTDNPWKAIIVYTLLTILFLSFIAFITFTIGYNLASTIAEIVINTLLIGLISYALVRFSIKKFSQKRQFTSTSK